MSSRRRSRSVDRRRFGNRGDVDRTRRWSPDRKRRSRSRSKSRERNLRDRERDRDRDRRPREREKLDDPRSISERQGDMRMDRQREINRNFDPTEFALWRYPGEGITPLSARPEFTITDVKVVEPSSRRYSSDDRFRNDRYAETNRRDRRPMENFTVNREKLSHNRRSPPEQNKMLSERWESGRDRSDRGRDREERDTNKWERLPLLRGPAIPPIEMTVGGRRPLPDDRSSYRDRMDDYRGKPDPFMAPSDLRRERDERDYRPRGRDMPPDMAPPPLPLSRAPIQYPLPTQQYGDRNDYNSGPSFGRYAESRYTQDDSGFRNRRYNFDRGGRGDGRGIGRGRGTVVYRPGEPEKPTLNLFDPQAVPRGRGYYDHDDRQGDMRGRGRGRGRGGWRGGTREHRQPAFRSDIDTNTWKHDMFETLEKEEDIKDTKENKIKEENKSEN